MLADEVAADDLLQLQSAALEKVLNAPGNETLALNAFAQRAESALGLPMLSLAEPLAVRQQTLVENNRPGFYKAATRSEQTQYRRLEGQVFKAVYALGGGVQATVRMLSYLDGVQVRETVRSAAQRRAMGAGRAVLLGPDGPRAFWLTVPPPELDPPVASTGRPSASSSRGSRPAPRRRSSA